MDEVQPYEPDQQVGRSVLQSPLPSALRRPSLRAGDASVLRRHSHRPAALTKAIKS